MSKQEILDKYYLLAETQEEFDSILDIFKENKGNFESYHYNRHKSNTYFYIPEFSQTNLFYHNNHNNSDNIKPFITYDKLLELLGKFDIKQLLDVPIICDTRDEWDNVMDWFTDNGIEYNFSIDDYHKDFYLVFTEDDDIIDLGWFNKDYLRDYFKTPITFTEFKNIVEQNHSIQLVKHKLTKDNLKNIVIKHLFKDKEVTNNYSDLLSFIDEIDKKFDLKLI